MKSESVDVKYLVTGATGWVGQTVLKELQNMLGHEKLASHVYAFASKRQFYTVQAGERSATKIGRAHV